ncbi:MAG: tetratricopeptide repeat protein [Elusimicrobiota bacterium]
MKISRAALALLLLAAACSKREAANYKHCLKLRVGMSKADMIKIMGEPEETAPYVEGKSLPYLKGRTAYEWTNPATMPGPDHVSFSDDTGKIESIRCSNAEITASVYVEPPAPSTATVAVSTPAAPAAAVSTAPAAPAPDFSAALAAYRKKELTLAYKIARPMADADNTDAQMLMGLLYSDELARGAGKESVNEAQKWFYRASRKKNCEAAYAYAALIEEGGASPEKVVEEFAFAAEMKCPAAELRQGLMLIDGYKESVAKDSDEGEKLLLEAAQGGSPQAQMILAERSQSVGKDPVEAYRWALAASTHPVVSKYDDPLHAYSNVWRAEDQAEARAKVKALAALMTPAQISDAKKRAAQP